MMEVLTRNSLLTLLALVLLQAPWLARPPHYDEANFLTLARGAALDPWRPHDVRINWQGVEERAFEVLSNPPGLAWWLAPVVDQHVAVQRIWMLPWLGLTLWGMWKLGQRFSGDAERSALLLVTSPLVFLATPALLPDAPLLACVVAGLGGFIHAVDRERPAAGWALLLGAASLFRYSALPLVGLLAWYAVRRGRSPLMALPALVPFALLILHDLHAYGAVHFLAMGRFQSVANAPLDVAHKGVALTCMLGGAAALPFFPWKPASWMGALVGALAATPFGGVATAFGALGGATLGAAVAAEGVFDQNPRDQRFLRAWWIGGALFLLSLRFTAARYWLPFLPALLLCVPTQRWTRRLLATQLTLAVLLAADDDRSARAQEELASQVARLGSGVFTGHWGWQWQMESRGWRAIDEGSRPSPGTLVAMPREAWPQPVDVSCNRVAWEGVAHAPFPWIPRGYSSEGRANLHANWIAGPLAGDTPVRTVVPWTFANDPYERVRVCQDCGEGGCEAPTPAPVVEPQTPPPPKADTDAARTTKAAPRPGSASSRAASAPSTSPSKGAGAGGRASPPRVKPAPPPKPAPRGPRTGRR